MLRRSFFQKLSIVATSVLSLHGGFSHAINSSLKKKLGFLVSGEGYDDAWAQLVSSLAQLGWIQGNNLEIITKRSHGQNQKVSGLVAELTEAKVDVIVTTGASAAREALKVEMHVPIVGAGMVDPLAAGLVASLAHPDTNLTGISILFDDISLKLLELLANIDPTIKKIATLSNPSSTSSGRVTDRLTRVAASIGIENQVYFCQDSADVVDAFKQMVANDQKCLLVLQSPYYVSIGAEIAQLAIQHRVICLGQAEVYATAGFMGSYGVSYPKIFAQSAKYVDKILKGYRINELPIEQADDIQIVLNSRTFKTLNYDVTGKLALMADKIIDG